MKFGILGLLAIALIGVVGVSVDAATYGPRQKFQQVVYLKYGGTGTGQNPDSPLPFADEDLWAIPANTVIENVYLLLDAAITGTTVLEVGDDDSASGYITDIAADFANVGMYGWSAKTYAGSYKYIQTAGATDAADVYRVPNAKYYAAAGKEIKLNITTANTAGKARVVIEGYRAGGYAP